MTLPEDPAIPLLGMYPQDYQHVIRTHAPVCSSALFIIAKKLERTHMSLNGGMDTENVLYLYNGILLRN